GDSRASPRSGTRQPPRSAGPASCSTTSGAQGRALRRAGVDELTIMALGGWRTRSMFARYAITDSRDLADAQAKLNAAFVGAPRTVLPLHRVVGDNLGTANSDEACGADAASKKRRESAPHEVARGGIEPSTPRFSVGRARKLRNTRCRKWAKSRELRGARVTPRTRGGREFKYPISTRSVPGASMLPPGRGGAPPRPSAGAGRGR